MDSGFDVLGCENPDYVGFDYMALLKGTGGLLSSFGGGGGNSDKEKTSSAAEIKQQLALQQAQQSASTTKMILIGLVALLGVGGLALALRR